MIVHQRQGLPDEILCIIFSFMSLTDCAWTRARPGEPFVPLSLVSKQFRRVVHPYIFDTLVLSHNERLGGLAEQIYADDTLFRLVRRVRIATGRDYGENVVGILDSLSFSPKVTHLCLAANIPSKTPLGILRRVFSAFEALSRPYPKSSLKHVILDDQGVCANNEKARWFTVNVSAMFVEQLVGHKWMLHSFTFPGHVSALSTDGLLLAERIQEDSSLQVLRLTSLKSFNREAYMSLKQCPKHVSIRAPLEEKANVPAWMDRIEFE
ncbi:hypothetical protein DL96DRAFT_1679529 [Flagelloscypha sp. PMI_526]|nr:hypothetical protein DL96DRAFT_1679529 [Flagelloscypha sp. PMI_526]